MVEKVCSRQRIEKKWETEREREKEIIFCVLLLSGMERI